MYPPKVQTITCRIEQRIRRGFYRDLLPVNDILQNEFHAARQTITRALRPLFASGLLECKSPQASAFHRYFGNDDGGQRFWFYHHRWYECDLAGSFQ